MGGADLRKKGLGLRFVYSPQKTIGGPNYSSVAAPVRQQWNDRTVALLFYGHSLGITQLNR